MNKNLRAIILAAGEGLRLRPHTLDRPKCLVELGGKPLLARQTEVLKSLGIRDITVVTGYMAHKIEAMGYRTVHNPDYASTNMVASLMCAAKLLDGSADVLVAYGDIVYQPGVVRALLQSQGPICTSVDRCWLRLWQIRFEDPLVDAETLRMNDSGDILELGRKPESLAEIEGQYMGLIKISAEFAPRLRLAYQDLNTTNSAHGKNAADIFMTDFLQNLIDSGQPVRAVPVCGGWVEVDTTEDLKLYNRMYREGTLSKHCRMEPEKETVTCGL